MFFQVMTFYYGYLRFMDTIEKPNYVVTLPKFHNFIITRVFWPKYALLRAKIINPCIEIIKIFEIFQYIFQYIFFETRKILRIMAKDLFLIFIYLLFFCQFFTFLPPAYFYWKLSFGIKSRFQCQNRWILHNW